jgi:hypothetical protein
MADESIIEIDDVILPETKPPSTQPNPIPHPPSSSTRNTEIEIISTPIRPKTVDIIFRRNRR